MVNELISALKSGIKTLSLTDPKDGNTGQTAEIVRQLADHLSTIARQLDISYRTVPAQFKARVFLEAFAKTSSEVLAQFIDDDIIPPILGSENPQAKEFVVNNCYTFDSKTNTLKIVHGQKMTQEDLKIVLDLIPVTIKQNVKQLILKNISLMTEVPDLSQLSLSLLQLSACRALTTLTNCPSTLTSLIVDHCPKLTVFPSLNCPRLELLELTNCFALKSFVGISDLPSLKAANLSGSIHFSDLSLFNQKKSLEMITLNGLPKIASLDYFSSFTCLKRISCQNSSVQSPGALKLRPNLQLDI